MKEESREGPSCSVIELKGGSRDQGNRTRERDQRGEKGPKRRFTISRGP